jgi:hypothetical protein
VAGRGFALSPVPKSEGPAAPAHGDSSGLMSGHTRHKDIWLNGLERGTIRYMPPRF